jgi:hypothetical protein
MLRKYLLTGVLLGQVIAILVLIALLLQRPGGANAAPLSVPDLAPATAPDAAPEAQIGGSGTYMWSFAAKFVCGFQPSMTVTYQGEPVVKPGNYATEINIHNPNYKSTPHKIKYIQLVNSGSANPVSVLQPQTWITYTNLPNGLGPDTAMLQTCNGLWSAMVPGPLPSPMPLFVGYLVILSPLDLDVDVVYTTDASGVAGTTPTSNAIDVSRVTGKRVFLPAGTLP